MATQPDTTLQNVRRLLYMFGAVTQVELKAFLDVTSIDTDQKKSEVRGAWKAAAEHFEEVQQAERGVAETIETRQLSEEYNRSLDSLKLDPLFASTFSSYPYQFEEVEIDKLVACQRTVHLEYVEKLKAEYERLHRNLLDFCLMPAQGATPVRLGRTAQNAFTASSENPGLRFLGAVERPFSPEILKAQLPGGQPVHVVTLVLGYASSTINGYRIGKRVVLNNGFHRMFALRQLGVTYAPVVVQQITHPELELPQHVAELPREYLVGNPRPALVKDFLDKRLTCEITQRSFLKAVQVGWGINESLVPR